MELNVHTFLYRPDDNGEIHIHSIGYANGAGHFDVDEASLGFLDSTTPDGYFRAVTTYSDEDKSYEESDNLDYELEWLKDKADVRNHVVRIEKVYLDNIPKGQFAVRVTIYYAS